MMKLVAILSLLILAGCKPSTAPIEQCTKACGDAGMAKYEKVHSNSSLCICNEPKTTYLGETK